MHIMVPNLDGHFIRQEKALSGVIMEKLACRRLRGESSKNVSRGEVVVIAGAAEKFAQCAFTRSRRAKDQDRAKRLIIGRNKLFFMHNRGF
jgi:hypothetical protein